MDLFDELTPTLWAVAATGAFLIGFAKSGIPGVGLLFVAVFAAVFPARQSVGIVLPLLILGDLVAVRNYRQHTQWRVVVRLLPWALAGIGSGRLILEYVDNRGLKIVIGSILVVLIALHLLRHHWQSRFAVKSNRADRLKAGTDALVGTAIGAASMTANAAGPLATLYFLACRLPKYAFLGTAGWFFCIVNLLKVPVACSAGMITSRTLVIDAYLAAFVLLGSLAGWWLVRHIQQKWFEWSALALTFSAAIDLLATA